jgi:hydrogenase maturation protein HypF
VQGVGFRPYVYRLAKELGIRGWVRNDGDGVAIEIAGTAAAVERFLARLRAEAPPLARIASVDSAAATDPACTDFRIIASGGGAISTEVAADWGVCADCLAELFAPANRRYRHAFINCTQCGPRYTILRDLPYDRQQTSMAAFTQCPDCRHEYESPENRRFHAEPNACPRCGPQLWIADGEGSRLAGIDAISETIARIGSGAIVAIKGLGGFHLACDARDAEAVARLRERKNREQKPFALMVANAASLAGLASVDDAARGLLESPERPVVLLRKQPAAERELPGVAPDLAWLGAMLPSTPLHTLIFHEAAGRPAGTGWLGEAQSLALVMTSANPGGEPLVIDNAEAVSRLRGIADAFLMHDRDIVARCDDSVLRMVDEAAARSPAFASGDSAFQFVRRARGYTPRAIALAGDAGSAPVLACGAHLKNTLCIVRGGQAFMSAHIGDLDNAASCVAFDEAARHLLGLLRVTPAIVAHDLHPDFYSSRFAAEYAERHGLARVAVQHHHAHIAAVMAEHRLDGEVLGLALDGVGLGESGGNCGDNYGGNWGGELLRVSALDFVRLGHLRELRLPGGDRAAREPWRMAASVLHALGRGDEIAHRFTNPAAALLGRLLDRGTNSPPSSSCGRWFDAAAALAGVGGVGELASFEGQAAMRYEGLAESYANAGGVVAALTDGYHLRADGVLDLMPLLARLADTSDPGYAAALFHVTLAAGLADWVEHAARTTGLSRVALGGGCCLNRLLVARLSSLLKRRGLSVFAAQQVPPNDGGLSLGQAWVARHRFNAGEI